MHVVSKKKLTEFWQHHRDAEEALKAWYAEAKHAQWHSFSDIKAQYGSADNVGVNRVVFNIKGNHYRLVVQIHYNTGTIYIRDINTHAEYNKINAETI